MKIITTNLENEISFKKRLKTIGISFLKKCKESIEGNIHNLIIEVLMIIVLSFN